MSRAALTVQELGLTGDADVAFTAATTDGFSIVNDGNVIVLAQNTDSAHDVVAAGVACEHGRTANITLSVGQNKTAAFPPLDPEAFNQSADLGKAYINIAVATGVSCAAIRFNRR